LPEFKKNKKLFLGEGSNILFTKDFNVLVVLNKLRGIEILKEDAENVWLRALAGEKWNNLVNFSTDLGYWGLENLTLIPGTVGAAPVQNIGAYGAELKDVLEKVEVYNLENEKREIFSKGKCRFNYRDSIFKGELKEKYFISAIVLKLSKKPRPNLSYEVLGDYLKKNNLEASLKNISKVVAEIRQSKLPDPKILGNAGSFFKNIYVDEKKLAELLKKYPDMPYFQDEKAIKVPAGWLIEQCGPRQGGTSWKGYREGKVGVHKKQALVLVNYGGATGREIKNFSKRVAASVERKFGLKLESEVNLL